MTNTENNNEKRPEWIKRLISVAILIFVFVFARFDVRGVRYNARRRLKSILGSRYSAFRKATKSNVVRVVITTTWTWSLIVPCIIAFVLHFTGIASSRLTLPSNVVSESLSLFSPVPLVLVGLVIPFLALAVSVVYSKMGSGAVAYAMKHNRVVWLVYSALVILGALILLQFFLAITDSVLGQEASGRIVSSVGWLIAFMSAWWVLYLIVLAGIGVTSVLAVFSPEKALKVINKEMIIESMRTLKREFEANLSLKTLEDALKDSYLEVGYFQPSDGELVTTKKTGIITNISFWGLMKINSLVTPQPNSFLKVLLTKPQYYIASRDNQIAGIRGHVSSSISLSLLKKAISSCYRIRKPKVEKDKLYQALEHYKEITNSFLKGDNEDFVRVALDGYGNILQKYIALDLKLSAKDSPGNFGDWRPIMLIMDALNKSVATVVSTSESKNVSMVAHWIKVLMQDCIRNQEEYLFSRLLNLYRSMFYYASKSHNTLGIHRSHFEPMQLLDFDIFRFGKTESVKHDKVAFRCRLAMLIVQHFARLLRDSLDANDPKAVAEMLLHLQPEELYGHFHPDLPFDCFEVERKLRYNEVDYDERRILEDQQKSCQILESFKTESRQWHVDILHNALMYLIDKITHKAIKIKAVEQVVNKVWSKFPNWSNTVDWLERYNVGRQIFDERLWEYWPESRRVQSKSPMAAPILVFTVRGLFLQSQSATPLDIPGLRTIDGFYNQIVETARIIQNTSDWRELTGVISVDTLKLFEEALENAKQKYNDDIAKSVRVATLSEEKISEFRQKVLDSYYDASILRHLVSQSTITNADDYESQVPQTISVQQNRYPKEAFIDQDRISYFGFGENEGRVLGQGIDEHIWKTIREKLADQRVIELESDNIISLDDALKQYDSEMSSSLFIVFSGRSEMRFNLWSAEKFIPAMQLGKQEQKGFYGEYDGIAVYTAFNSAIDGIMIFSKNDVVFEDLQEPIINIADFTDDERKNLAKRANIDEEKLKEEVFVKINVTQKLAISKDCNTIILTLAQE